MKPEVASRFAQYCLVIIVNFFMTNSARIDGGCVRILRIEYHRLIWRVYFASRNGHWLRTRASRVGTKYCAGRTHWTHGSTLTHATHRTRHGTHVIHVCHIAHRCHIHSIHTPHVHVSHHW